MDKYIKNYKYTKCIGHGSYSKVYLGSNITTGQVCAIKIINYFNIAKKLKERLDTEIELMKRLDHPHIVKFIDVIKDDEDIYIISEYCEGGTLSKLLKKSLTEQDAKLLIKQLANGLQYLHNNCIIHRDLKPENILLTNSGQIKIADFGFAREYSENTMMNTICGSPLYMSPEVLLKNKYNAKTDLWSVGVIMYQMIYYNHPYNHPKNIIELLKNIKSRKIDYTTKSVSPECYTLLTGLLAVNPNDRISWDEFFNSSWITSSANTSGQSNITTILDRPDKSIKPAKPPELDKLIVQNIVDRKSTAPIKIPPKTKKVAFADTTAPIKTPIKASSYEKPPNKKYSIVDCLFEDYIKKPTGHDDIVEYVKDNHIDNNSLYDYMTKPINILKNSLRYFSL
ncbi:MAG: serine/threonine protein kinase [Faunusvirus sp.]|jgi:serine/threonine protein kinase|uniref:Serine/threonine protein kinase n=1 Tax=Faunusvirus sp. TaxID=2487766 RepID=A0A3G4ZW58_9VIRU|nr:MAG: serine/threonine protein kinase [Faunusvirus sp.]